MIKLNLTLPPDYEPSTGEVDNFVYLCCKCTIGWQMRAADLAVCRSLAGEIKGVDGINNLLRVTCEYIWDHLAGEPDDVSAEQFGEHMAPILEGWYQTTTLEQRAQTE